MSTIIKEFTDPVYKGRKLEVYSGSNGICLLIKDENEGEGRKFWLNEENLENFLETIHIAAQMQGIKLINY